MNCNVIKTFKNGNKVIKVDRTVTSYYKVNKNGEVQELATKENDELKENNFLGLSNKFWNFIDKICK